MHPGWPEAEDLEPRGDSWVRFEWTYSQPPYQSMASHWLASLSPTACGLVVVQGAASFLQQANQWLQSYRQTFSRRMQQHALSHTDDDISDFQVTD